MKTLLISNFYPPNTLGGYERLCFSVAESLIKYGHQVGVLTSSYGGQEQDYPGQIIWRSLSLLATEGNIYEPFCASQEKRDEITKYNINILNNVINEYKPDIIFVWNLYFLDASFVCHIENCYSDKVVYFLTDNWLISFFNTHFLGQFFQKVVFGNESERQFGIEKEQPTQLNGRAIFGSAFMERFYEDAGICFADTIVIHNGVHLQEPSGNVCSRDRLYPVRHGFFRLLFAGRVVDVKGVETILKALPLIVNELPNVEVSLEIIGNCQDKAYRARLDEIIKRSGLDDVVRFREPVPQSQLFALFQEFDIYIFPSLYEPFALTLIYALNAGIPTVASDVGGNPEIVFDGDTGLLFKKNDANDLHRRVLELYRNPLKRVQISRHAQAVSWKYTFETMIVKIDRYLRS